MNKYFDDNIFYKKIQAIVQLFQEDRRSPIMAKNKNNEVTIRSSAAENLTYVASVGEETQNI